MGNFKNGNETNKTITDLFKVVEIMFLFRKKKKNGDYASVNPT